MRLKNNRRTNKFKKIRRNCYFCKTKLEYVDYKEILLLKKFIAPNGQIMPKRITGTCSSHQRQLATAIKRAREIAFLPFIIE